MQREASGYPALALLIVAFILYGSLYPFRFGIMEGGAVAHLLGTWRAWDHPADLLSNILLYMPLGFTGVNAVPRRWPVAGRMAITTAVGIGLSVGVELTQFYDRGRDSTLGDVYANAIGTGVGVLVGSLVQHGAEQPWLRPLARDKPAALILAAWFGYRAYPYVPTIDPHKYAHALAAVVLEPAPEMLDVLRFTAAWLLIAMVVRTLYGRRHWLVLGLLIGLEFAVRVMAIDATLSLKDVLGALLAVAIWRMAGWWRHVGLGVAVAFAGAVVAQRLAPFDFARAPLHGFGWVPFLSFMQGSTGVDVQAFCEKTFTYGGMIWLLRRSGLGLVASSSVTALLLAATSVAQVWLPGRSAEVTDVVLASGLGYTMFLLRPAVP